jgi:UDP-2-acetamido-3-amino-2,3-dideoxy-glucuronate N-acetyltransferase
MIHPLSDVRSEKIGLNTFIWQYVVILPGAIIGENCNVNCHCFIENQVIIGNNVTLKSGVFLWDGISIEDDVFIGPGVVFVNDFVPRSKQYQKGVLKTLIKKGASIGANATLMGNITIGEYAMIGAASMVTKNIPANSLWYGNPATFRGFVCNCGNKLGKDMYCPKCKKAYNLELENSIKK